MASAVAILVVYLAIGAGISPALVAWKRGIVTGCRGVFRREVI